MPGVRVHSTSGTRAKGEGAVDHTQVRDLFLALWCKTEISMFYSKR